MALPLGVILESTALAGAGVSAFVVMHAVSRTQASGPAQRMRAWRHPLVQLAFVSLLLFANQVAFNAFVRGAHHGDPAFVARYVPLGWFAVVPDHPLVVAVAGAFVAHMEWLSISVLRVQAFLELPFVLFAYLSIAHLLDRAVYRALVQPFVLVAASVAFTVPFDLAELWLTNPWTTDDLIVRAIACVVVPPYVAWLARHERGGPVFPAILSRPTGLVGLATFLVGAAATCAIVLVMYDVTLIYNLRHLGDVKELLVVAWAAAALAHVGDGRFDGFAHRLISGSYEPAPPASFGVRVATSMLATFTVAFFVPSLAIRYGGAHPVVQVVAAALLLGSAVLGFVLAYRQALPSAREATSALLAAGVASIAGALAAATDLGGLLAMRDPVAEALLLRKSAIFLGIALPVWRGAERVFAATPTPRLVRRAP